MHMKNIILSNKRKITHRKEKVNSEFQVYYTKSKNIWRLDFRKDSTNKTSDLIVIIDNTLVRLLPQKIANNWSRGSRSLKKDQFYSQLPPRFISLSHNAWKVFVFGVFLVCIFRPSDWIRRDTAYLSVFSPNTGKDRPEKLRIRTLFTQSQSQLI